MVDEATKENISIAHELFKLSVPVYLCLGNHDLNKDNAVNLWLSRAPDFFSNGTPNYSIKKDNICIHVIPNQWDNTDYHWSSVQEPHFLDEQLVEIKKNPPIGEVQTHFLCTHSPIFSVPPNQTGYSHEYHSAGEFFESEVLNLIDYNPLIRCVLSDIII